MRRYLTLLILLAERLIVLAAEPCESPHDTIDTLGHDAVLINEIMQSNVQSLMVEHDFPDSWVELYNAGDTLVSLTGWRIGPGPDASYAYTLPEAVIAPHGHQLIYCDKKGQGLHADFRLDADGGMLCLFDSCGLMIDSLAYDAMPAPDVAYGRSWDGDSLWQHELMASPGAANAGGGSEILAPNPVFSLMGQLMTEPGELTVSLPADSPEDAALYWTLDGSEPDEGSPHGSQLQLNIDHSVVVRAKVMAPGMLQRPSTAHAYIFHPRQTDIPIVSLATPDDYLFGEVEGILSGLATDTMPNYRQLWRRPVAVQYLAWDTAASDVSIHQWAEVAVGGATSRDLAQKTLKLYAHKRFGTKRLKGHLWADKPEVDRVKSLMLRNGGSRSDGGMIHDAVAQRIFGWHLASLDWQAYEPVICYINGTYRGVFELRERSDEDYVAANYGTEDIELTKSFYRGGEAWNRVYKRAVAGAGYDELSQLIDMENAADYLATEIFVANTDWPDNNAAAWRPTAEGGRWRFILKDLDQFSFYPTEKNFLRYLFLDGEEGAKPLSNGHYRHHRVFCALNALPEFRQMLIDRLMTYLGDFLRPTVTLALFEEMAARIEPELSPTKEVWGRDPSLAWVHHQWDSIRSYLQHRPMDLYEDMADYYQLGRVIPLVVHRADVAVSIGGVGLTEGDFEGACFSDHDLRLLADSPDCGWQLNTHYTDGSMLETTLDAPSITYRPSADEAERVASLEFTPVHREAWESLAQLTDDDETGHWTLMGQRINNATPGISIVRFADGRVARVWSMGH